MNAEGLSAGVYKTPHIGGIETYSAAETVIEVDVDGLLYVTSPLQEDSFVIGDQSTFKDPRTDTFLKLAIEHQLHHLDVRQLSLPEHLETRPGAGRYSRLGGVLDSARILARMGATHEQMVQTLISDFAHPAGSHLRGDFLTGDYQTQDTHDGALWSYIVGSGLYDYLQQHGAVDDAGLLAGSQYTLEQLADPRTPRRHDITECPRPDANADRLEFTLHEGVLIHDPKEVQEVLDHVIRVETADGERMAFTSAEAARLVFKLAIRHQSEHWGEPMHRFQEELILLIDRYAAVADSPLFAEYQQYRPTDYAYTAEHVYYDRLDQFSGLDPLVTGTLALAQAVSAQQSGLDFHGTDDHAYKGPVLPSGTVIDEHDYASNLVSINEDELWVRLKAPKYRGPIDGLVVTQQGLVRVSELMPELKAYEQERKRWLGSLLVRMQLPSGTIKELRRGVALIGKTWGAPKKDLPARSPLFRPAMPSEQLRSNIDHARASMMQRALMQ